MLFSTLMMLFGATVIAIMLCKFSIRIKPYRMSVRWDLLHHAHCPMHVLLVNILGNVIRWIEHVKSSSKKYEIANRNNCELVSCEKKNNQRFPSRSELNANVSAVENGIGKISSLQFLLFLFRTNFTHLIVPIACCGIFLAEGHPKMRSVTVNKLV